MPKISVIVAIYNIENFLPRCINSILAQSFGDFECILVDDGSDDSCSALCDGYAEKDKRIVVIHKENQGLPQARKSGFAVAKSDWLLFVDGDDWLETNMLQLLWEAKSETEADLIVCDFYKDYSDKTLIRSFSVPKEKSAVMRSFITNPGYMNYFWNKLIKKSLFAEHSIDFPSGISLCEDLYVTFKLCYFAKNISQVSIPLYHYVQTNTSSITKNPTEKSFLDKVAATNEIETFLKREGREKEFSDIIHFYKLYTKVLLILYKPLRNKNLWKQTYPEASNYIWKVPLRLDYKIMSWLCAKGFFLLAYLLQDLKKGEKNQ